MNREKALDEFVKSLRTAFNNALAYPKEHPFFLKSVEELKSSVDNLLNFLNPIEIKINPKGLFVNGCLQDKFTASVELAKMLRSRRIEKIWIKPGLSINELSSFLGALTLPLKDIISEGGLGAILKRSLAVNISVESIDYSSLLASQGGYESNNRQGESLSSLATAKDKKEVIELADSFLKNFKDIKANDLLTDKGLRNDLSTFLLRLKDVDKEKFSACLTKFFDYLSGASSELPPEDLNALKEVFSGLGEEDFSYLLWSNLTKDAPPDSLFFNFFSAISEGVNQGKVAQLVALNTKSKKDPYALKKIKNLLSSPASDSLSFTYRNALSGMLKDISASGDLLFDYQEIKLHYYFALLNMLKEEDNPKRQELILERINKEAQGIMESNNFQYIGYLMDLIADKKNSLEVPKEVFNLEDKLIELIEESVWDDDTGLFGLLERVRKSRKESSYYLNKIFEEGKISSLVLSLFFRFFPEELNTFYLSLKEKKDNLDFLSRVVKALESLDTELSFLALNYIYSFSGEIIRVEIIKAMRKITKANKGFLVAFLKGSSRIMKREILLTLFDNKKELSMGLKELFYLPNLFGRNNRELLENIAIVEELRLKEAEEFLSKFTRLRFFWHVPLRKKALKVLEAIR